LPAKKKKSAVNRYTIADFYLPALRLAIRPGANVHAGLRPDFKARSAPLFTFRFSFPGSASGSPEFGLRV
jgi:hypothetical protein